MYHDRQLNYGATDSLGVVANQNVWGPFVVLNPVAGYRNQRPGGLSPPPIAFAPNPTAPVSTPSTLSSSSMLSAGTGVTTTTSRSMTGTTTGSTTGMTTSSTTGLTTGSTTVWPSGSTTGTSTSSGSP